MNLHTHTTHEEEVKLHGYLPRSHRLERSHRRTPDGVRVGRDLGSAGRGRHHRGVPDLPYRQAVPVVLGTILAALALLTFSAAPAAAQALPSDDWSPPQLRLVTEAVEDGGVGPVDEDRFPGNRDNVVQLRQAEEALETGTQTEPKKAVLREVEQLRTRVGILPKLAKFGGNVALGVGAFTAGWQIGSEIRSMWVGEEVPAPSTVYSMPMTGQRAIEEGHSFNTGLTSTYYDQLTEAPDYVHGDSTVIADEDLWVATKQNGVGVWNPISAYQDPGGCEVPSPSFTGWNVLAFRPCYSIAAFGVGYAATHRPVPKAPRHEKPSSWESQGDYQWPNADDPAPHLNDSASEREEAVQSELHDHPERYPTLLPWLDSQVGGASEDPTFSGAHIPSCTGDLYAACVVKLNNAGFENVTRRTATFTGADVEKPGNAVLDLNPDTGALIDFEHEVEVVTNPAPEDMPRLIPDPTTNETYAHYLARLRSLGFLGQISNSPVSETALNPALGPDAVLGTRPEVGTRVEPDADIVVRTNPETAPEPSSDPSPFAFSVPTPDLSPLTAAVSGCKFPFCVFSWAGSIFEGWVGSSTCPNWTVNVAGLGDLNLDMCFMNPFMTIWRYAVLITSALMMAFTFARFALGAST